MPIHVGASLPDFVYAEAFYVYLRTKPLATLAGKIKTDDDYLRVGQRFGAFSHSAFENLMPGLMLVICSIKFRTSSKQPC